MSAADHFHWGGAARAGQRRHNEISITAAMDSPQTLSTVAERAYEKGGAAAHKRGSSAAQNWMHASGLYPSFSRLGRQANLIMGGGPHRQQMVSSPAAGVGEGGGGQRGVVREGRAGQGPRGSHARREKPGAQEGRCRAQRRTAAARQLPHRGIAAPSPSPRSQIRCCTASRGSRPSYPLQA